MAILNNYLKSIANAIRNKTGKVEFINAQNFASEIENMEPKYDTLEITKNGIFGVKDYKNAQVVVPSNDFETIKKLVERQYDANDTSITIPYGIEILGISCVGPYYDKVTLPNSLKLICGAAFTDGQNKTSSKDIYYQGSLEEWLKITKGILGTKDSSSKPLFSASIYNTKKYTLYINNIKVNDIELSNIEVAGMSLSCIYLNSLYIKEGVTFIETEYPYARKNFVGFCNGSEIKDVVLDYDENYNYNGIFDNSVITNLIYNEGNKIIGPAYSESAKITTLTTPSSATELNLNYCKITTLIMNATTPPTLGKINEITKIWVPKGTLETYKSATNWSSYGSKIFSKLTVVFNVDASLINNTNVTYSIDDGALQQFTQSSFQKDDIYKLVISNTDANTTILVGTTQGGSDLATISNATTTINISTDTNIYITKQ